MGNRLELNYAAVIGCSNRTKMSLQIVAFNALLNWKEYDKVRRIEGKEVKTLVNRFITAYNTISKIQIMIPPSGN